MTYAPFAFAAAFLVVSRANDIRSLLVDCGGAPVVVVHAFTTCPDVSAVRVLDTVIGEWKHAALVCPRRANWGGSSRGKGDGHWFSRRRCLSGGGGHGGWGVQCCALLQAHTLAATRPAAHLRNVRIGAVESSPLGRHADPDLRVAQAHVLLSFVAPPACRWWCGRRRR